MVGWDEGVSYEVQKAGNWKSTILGGEGLVVELTGPGRVYVQTRSPEGFLDWLIAEAPDPAQLSRSARVRQPASLTSARRASVASIDSRLCDAGSATPLTGLPRRFATQPRWSVQVSTTRHPPSRPRTGSSSARP